MSNRDAPESNNEVENLPKQLLEWIQEKKVLDRKELAELEKGKAQQASFLFEGMEARVVDPRQLSWPGDLADDWDADDY